MTIFDHLAYVRVSWSNGQKFLTMTTAKISKLPWSNGQKWPFLTIFYHDHDQKPRITVVKWLKLVNLTIDRGQNRGCHGHGQLF